MKITRAMCESDMVECYKQCARYAMFIIRIDWQDDRGNLSQITYKNSSTFYRFTMLNGTVVESEWWSPNMQGPRNIRKLEV